MRTLLSSFFLSIICISCTSSEEAIKPKLDYAVQDKYLKHLEPLFHPLTREEKKESWGHEYSIGLAFAKKLDLFHAITSFKRADILIPEDLFARKAEIEYQILNCYYLAKRYDDVIDTFENSVLASTDRNFIAFHDLFIILFESYQKCEEVERAKWTLHLLNKHFPIDGAKLQITNALLSADFEALKTLAISPDARNELALLDKKSNESEGDIKLVSEIEELSDPFAEKIKHATLKDYTECQDSTLDLLSTYKKYKKSPALAGALNAILPGAGYLYLGQKQSAFTAFCLNSLFIGTAYYFYQHGNIPAMAITASFESGWYFGGIQGAKKGALLYNERLFETHAHQKMRDHKLYPVLMLSHGF